MGLPLVICPLAYERRFLRKPLKGRATVIVSGPGPEAVARAVEAHAPQAPPVVVLCGVAGAIRESPRSPRIAAVIDKDARRWDAPSVAPGSDEAVTVIGLDEPASTVERKRRLAGAYGAHLVDTESHAFAAACTRLGLRWAVIRGVSDGPDEALPAAVMQWVDEKGRARPVRLLLHMILEPATLPAALRLRRRTKAAMRAVASRALELVIAERSTEVDPLSAQRPAEPQPKRTARAAEAAPTFVEEQLSVERLRAERRAKESR